MGEIRHAVRRLRATPLVSLTAIACLSIGVWMTCIVSAVGRGFIRPNLGVPAADRLVQLDEKGLYLTTDNARRMCCIRYSSKAILDSLSNRKLFAAVGFYDGAANGQIVGETDLRAFTMLSSGMMQVLSVPVMLGRGFIPADDTIEAVLITEELWRSAFGADPSVIGRRIRLYQFKSSLPVVGVVREGFMFPRNGARPAIYVSPGASRLRGYPALRMLARLREGDDVADVESPIRAIATRNVQFDREQFRLWYHTVAPKRPPPQLIAGPVNIRLVRYYNEPLPAEMLSFLALVIASGLAVVLIAAANVANVLLIRGAARRREIAVRMALGAQRSRIIRELVTETGIVGCVGVFFGFLLAFWQWRLLDASFDGRQFLGDIDFSTVFVALFAGIALALLVGVWPGLRATAMNLEEVLRDTRRAGIGGSPLESLLGRMVTASMAATVMLLASALMLGFSARDTLKRAATSQRDVLTSLLTLDETQTRTQRADRAREALARLRAMPGVRNVALGVAPPHGEYMQGMRVAAEGMPERTINSVDTYDVSDAYFEAMDIRLLQGRGFLPEETRDSTSAVIVSRDLAKAMFGGRAAVGSRFRYRSAEDSTDMADATVIGIADSVGGARHQIYRPFGAVNSLRTPVLVRYRDGQQLRPAAMLATLRSVPGLLSSDVTRVGEQSASGLKLLRYIRFGFAQFAIVGLILAAIGTYGIVAYSVVRRTHEIGVRMALGAEPKRVTWMIVEQGLKVTLAGVIIGLLLTFGSTKLLVAIFREVQNYPSVIAGVVVAVSVISIVASIVPAYRAGRVNPVEALRSD
jgi:putative ABC transport system permease protein